MEVLCTGSSTVMDAFLFLHKLGTPDVKTLVGVCVPHRCPIHPALHLSIDTLTKTSSLVNFDIV